MTAPNLDGIVIDHTDEHHADGPTTWEPVDLGPYLRGEVERPEPSIGIARNDGQRFIYPGREHSVIGETESGKTWFAIGSAALEIFACHRVVYIHYEESDPGSTIERLRLFGISDTMIQGWMTFVAPALSVRKEWLQPHRSARRRSSRSALIDFGIALNAASTRVTGE